MNLFDAPGEPAQTRAKPATPLRAWAKRIKAPSIEKAVTLSARETSIYLGVAVSTLKSWRAKKIGPKWTYRGADQRRFNVQGGRWAPQNVGRSSVSSTPA